MERHGMTILIPEERKIGTCTNPRGQNHAKNPRSG